MARTKSLEASMQALDEVLEKLEEEEITLEESFKLYTKGVKLLKECKDSIDKVEKQLIILNEEEQDEI